MSVQRYRVRREGPGLWVARLSLDRLPRGGRGPVALRRSTHADVMRDLCQLLKIRAELAAHHRATRGDRAS